MMSDKAVNEIERLSQTVRSLKEKPTERDKSVKK
jgi:hypothetical protein